jgi:hypothetical protein
MMMFTIKMQRQQHLLLLLLAATSLAIKSTLAFVTPLETTRTKNLNKCFSDCFNNDDSPGFPSLVSITSSSSHSSTSLNLSLSPAILSEVSSTLFASNTIIPLLPSLALNTFLFTTLRSKLNSVLTPEGFAHSFALGTLLWHTLGWKGWTTCVVYLALGSLVTNVKFKEKEAMGIAEGRGGRRGPENVWYVLLFLLLFFLR